MECVTSVQKGSRSLFFTLLFVYLSFYSFYTFAKPDIKIGMSTALSGPIHEVGEGMRLGVDTYFKKINEEGGIDGRQLKLITYNDSYEPEQTIINMYRLIEKDKVLAIIGNVGTPTAIVSVPIVSKKGVLLYGAFTGASLLRTKPTNPYVINFRASYAQETSAIISGLLKAGYKPSEIAFFTQDDGYGSDGYDGAIAALKKFGYKNARALPHGRYERNTLNVEAGLSDILLSGNEPKAIVIIGAYAPVAQFIKLAKQDYPNVKFFNVSFVGGTALAKALGSKGDNVFITEVVPHFLSSFEGVNEYRQDLARFGNGSLPGFTSLEGYLSARLFVKALRKASAENKLTRKGFIHVFETMKKIDIGINIPITINGKNHQALDRVWPTKIKEGKVVPMEWGELKEEKL